MTERKTIPIVVGITGHRNIRSEDRDALYGAVVRSLAELRSRCPHSELLMLNSLAEGADQLCAEAAASLSIPLIAALPMEQKEYERDFSGDALDRFRAFCGSAKDCFVVPATEDEPKSPDRDFAYRQAGIYVAAHAHILLALWDGEPTPSSNCGTAEAVRFVTDCAYQPADGIPLHGFGAVLQIKTPRAGANHVADAGATRLIGDEASLREILARTDEFNRLVEQHTAPAPSLLPKDREPDARLDGMEALYTEADTLSVRFAKQYRRILAALAIISTIVTISFLLYDDMELHWMILACGLMLLAAWAVQRRGKRIACHRRYLEYRALAEGLRVQAFLRYAGSKLLVSEILPWSAHAETAWIAAALTVAAIGAERYGTHQIKEPWVEQQRDYHARAAKKTQHALLGSDRIVGIAFWISIALYLAVLVFELVWGDVLPIGAHLADAERFRMLPKLLLGGLSAATLFTSNYFGRLSLSRVVSDHGKMERFFAAVADRIERYGQTDELLLLLAREELIENGNWCSYQRDNAAVFSL